VSYGGFLGFGGQQVAIPWSAFSFDSADNAFTIPADRTALESAPTLSELGPEGITAAGWDSAVQQYWQQRGVRGAGSDDTGSIGSGTVITGTGTVTGTTGTGSGIGGTGTMTGTTGTGTTGTGTGVGATGAMTGTAGTTTVASGAQLLRADRIIGMDIRGADLDAGLGDVTDLLVNVGAGQVLYILLGSGGFLGIGQTTTAVPWEALQFSSGDNSFMLDVTAADLQGAPQLSLESLPETVDANWDASVRQWWQTRTSR
jgi:hypothetical protein